MLRDLDFTAHAIAVMEERGIERLWVDRVIAAPAWTEPDRVDPLVRLLFGSVPERDDHMLRVVYNPSEHRVITVFLDRTRRSGPRRTTP